MICVIKMAGNVIVGGIIATDIYDAQCKAQVALDNVLVQELQELDQMEISPTSGKHWLEKSGCWLLVAE